MRIYRLELELEEYNKTLEHCSGAKMSHVDALIQAVRIMVLGDNTLEANLIASQNLDKNIVELRN